MFGNIYYQAMLLHEDWHTVCILLQVKDLFSTLEVEYYAVELDKLGEYEQLSVYKSERMMDNSYGGSMLRVWAQSYMSLSHAMS